MTVLQEHSKNYRIPGALCNHDVHPDYKASLQIIVYGIVRCLNLAMGFVFEIPFIFLLGFITDAQEKACTMGNKLLILLMWFAI